ncbi:hypothetical protein [Burkholderia vietnamiensis]|uniref:hypothetical protein n=1 Tax=Burkholderia vietnamiensis TaxID=60552 RepID=UPI001CF1D3E8|nr:hypothetical protein [Burkholderia vietnamiensis]MCA7984120.1 hypothetical protein [Burkholderia vietnamiensis]
MTLNDLLLGLKSLPEDSPVNAAQIVEILKVLIHEKKEVQPNPTDFDTLPASQLIDEQKLAEWIAEPLHTIQKWRLKGGIGPDYVKLKNGSVRYKVGIVREWIDSSIISNTTQGTAKGIKR